MDPFPMDTRSAESCDCSPLPGADPNAPCCGGAPPPPSRAEEQPGYAICGFVDTFAHLPTGRVPMVTTRLSLKDRLGTAMVRSGIRRGQYTVAPGLYGIGHPDAAAPVLVTANYKLTFDILRSHLAGTDAWILVLDTHGINVWCAAGKKTFSTKEVVKRVRECRLDEVVDHRRLVLPQLGATGVDGRQVRRSCGFEVLWGPIRSEDLRSYLSSGFTAASDMRKVTFTLVERAVLVPVELAAVPKPLLWTCLAALVMSGIGREVFSLQAAWTRGGAMIAACLAGIFCGAVVTPLLLPWLPGRPFAGKGALVGAVGGLLLVLLAGPLALLEGAALLLLTTAVSSYLAMNFTGSTPFTSPSGVEKEMRRAMPLQGAAVGLFAAMWLGSAFAGF
jgi:hypothetical protein